MTAVKRMTPTSDFLKMSLRDRNCEVEEYEDCRTRNLLKECHSNVKETKQRSSFQDCLEKYASRIFKCQEACEGIHADVAWNDEDVLNDEKKTGNGVELNRDKLLQIIQEYREKKAKFVKNFVFKADKNYPLFGRFLLKCALSYYKTRCLTFNFLYLSDAFISRGGAS